MARRGLTIVKDSRFLNCRSKGVASSLRHVHDIFRLLRVSDGRAGSMTFKSSFGAVNGVRVTLFRFGHEMIASFSTDEKLFLGAEIGDNHAEKKRLSNRLYVNEREDFIPLTTTSNTNEAYCGRRADSNRPC